MFGVEDDDLTWQDRLKRVGDRMKEGGRQELKGQIINAVPEVGAFFKEKPEDTHMDPLSGYNPEARPEGYEEPRQNFAPDESEDEYCLEDDTDEEEYEEVEEDYSEPEDGEPYSLAFEERDEPYENLAMAAAAWRLLSKYEDDFVAQHD